MAKRYPLLLKLCMDTRLLGALATGSPIFPTRAALTAAVVVLFGGSVCRLRCDCDCALTRHAARWSVAAPERDGRCCL